MTKEKIVIEMDDREPEMQLLADINEVNIDFDRKRLTCGDFIYKQLIVERKTVDDFCASILDNRLEEQVARMNERGDNNFIFIIGRIDSSEHRKGRESLGRKFCETFRIFFRSALVFLQRCLNSREVH